jgi:uncharacterized membrane protein YagU involved in acid resistance
MRANPSRDTITSRSVVAAGLRGAEAGAAATLVMSAAMLELQHLGWLGQMPPRLIVGRVFSAAGVRRRARPWLLQAATTVAHFGFGALSGAVFGAARVLARSLVRPAQRAHAVSEAAAVTFGIAIWAGSYAGWLPALGLMPFPSRDRPGRPTSMLMAHIVFGWSLAATLHALESRSKSKRGDAFGIFHAVGPRRR